MGFISWIADKISSLGQPPEVKEALREGAKAARAEQEKFAKEAVPMPRSERRKLAKEVKASMRTLEKMKKQARKDNKTELTAMKQDALENDWFRKGEILSQAHAEAAEVGDLTGLTKKHIKVDVNEIATMSQLLAEMEKNVKQAEQVSIKAAVAVNAQDNEILRLKKLLEDREGLSKQITDIIDRKLHGEASKQLEKQHSALIKQLSRLDREIMGVFQRIITTASQGSELRSDIDFVIQLLAPISKTAPMLTKKVNDEIRQAKDLLKVQGAIVAAMKPAMKAKRSEIEMIETFVQKLDKAA